MPSPFHRDRLKALRTEAGWSQAELAEKIDSDARQVSRYENSKVALGLEAVIRMAQVFNVTVDHLLIDDAERRPLSAPSSHIDARLAHLDQLSDAERATITNVIDALVTRPSSASSPADCCATVQPHARPLTPASHSLERAVLSKRYNLEHHTEVVDREPRTFDAHMAMK